MRKLLMLVIAALACSGCATMIRGTTERLDLESDPQGASAQLSNGQTCTTPCSVEVPRGTAVHAKFSKGGCSDSDLLVSPTMSGWGVAWAVWFGGIFDFMTGAVYDLTPNPARGSLSCKVVATQPGALATDQSANQ